MKKYITKRHCSECVCENCGKTYLKPDSEINRNIKLGRKSFCSIACAIQYRENNNPLTEKQKQNRENFKNFAGVKGNENISHKRMLNDPFIFLLKKYIDELRCILPKQKIKKNLLLL